MPPHSQPPSRTPSISISSPPPTNSYPVSTPSNHSSRNNSLDIPCDSPRRPPNKRNRSALRQFYGLSASGEVLEELDRKDFVEKEYLDRLLATKSVKELLVGENDLVNDIRGLDGERKALVYDNYSKLIAATDTIRRMRASMEPLTPTTSTLEPAVSHIEGVSRELVANMKAAGLEESREVVQARTVKWALAAPERIRRLRKEGKQEKAQQAWERLQQLCDKWKTAKGIEELRRKGEEAVKEESNMEVEGGKMEEEKKEEETTTKDTNEAT
ncbi:Vps51/Vps67-domain-containing protein [Pyronema omphalodes]|nr:Vps51/Vps67-domain-containing protein [Pyronema omphalodes]